MPTFSSLSHYKTQSSANIFLFLKRLLPVTNGWNGPYSQMKFSLVSKESHISFNPLEKCQDTMLKKQANSISIKLYFYTCWDSDDEDFWDYEVFYTCVPLKPGDINSATWAYWIISSISYYPLWLRLYSLQKYVLVLTISLDRWMMDYRWKWYSKCISLNIKMNIILGYFARFPLFNHLCFLLVERANMSWREQQ